MNLANEIKFIFVIKTEFYFKKKSFFKNLKISNI